VTDPRATIQALAADTESGAAEIAERAAGALVAIPRSGLQEAIEVLLRGHPEMAPLWRLGSDLLSATDPGACAERFLSRLIRDGDASGAIASLLPDRLLTISYSSTVRQAVVARRPAAVLCMRSDPGEEGVRMAAALSGTTAASVIEDDDAIARCPADAVLVGADAITPTSLVNKVKTGRIAESARDHGIPCFAVAGDTKFVPVELPCAEPFEAAELQLFSRIATPDGVLTPELAAQHASSAAVHSALLDVAERFREERSMAGPIS
jgi:hypothetical protein